MHCICKSVCLRQWFSVKHIQTSCSLFGIVWWPNAARLTQLWRQIWPRKFNHKSWCWGNPQALLNKEQVYYQGVDIYCQNIMRLVTFKHKFIKQSNKLHNFSNLSNFHHFKASKHNFLSSNMHSQIRNLYQTSMVAISCIIVYLLWVLLAILVLWKFFSGKC